MAILVTGGAGFIGSHIVEELIFADRSVVVVDNLEGGRLENLESVSNKKNFSFVNADVRNLEEIQPHFRDISGVIHLAALADIVPSVENPKQYFETNVTGTLNVLTAAKMNGCQRFVYAASSSCYGIPDRFPTAEDAEIRPQYPYALTKRLGEELVMHWGQVFSLDVVSLRLFNVYGPRVRTNGAYGAVMGVFLAQRANDAPLTIVGDGSQTRDFTHVRDIASAFLMALDSKIRSEIMNVGSGGHYSVQRLASLIGGPTVNVRKRPAEPQCTYAQIQKIRKLLGWSPKIRLEDGVAEMLEQLEVWKSAPLWTEESISKATRAWFAALSK
jgi:UDP-glucose 4-epimerase